MPRLYRSVLRGRITGSPPARLACRRNAWDNRVVAKKTIGQRVDRLEQVVQLIAEDQVSLQKLIADLARETRKGFDRVAKQFEETDRRIAEMEKKTDERFRQTDERMRERDQRIDERIDKLVSAMGEFIRRQNGSQK